MRAVVRAQRADNDGPGLITSRWSPLNALFVEFNYVMLWDRIVEVGTTGKHAAYYMLLVTATREVCSRPCLLLVCQSTAISLKTCDSLAAPSPTAFRP